MHKILVTILMVLSLISCDAIAVFSYLMISTRISNILYFFSHTFNRRSYADTDYIPV